MSDVNLNDIILKCENHLFDTETYGTDIEYFLTEFLLITIHREYELCIKKCIINKISKSNGDDEVISYVENLIKYKSGIKLDLIKQILKSFNENYVKKFADVISASEIRSYSSITSNRITVAHKKPVDITISDLKDWHTLAKNIPKKFSDVLLNTESTIWTKKRV